MNEELRTAIAEELEIEPETLTPDKVLVDIDTWDSVMALTIMVILSDEIGTPVSPNEMKCLRTFGDVEKLVLSKKQG
ncbi:MAG: acyl carrier protein [Chlorobiaceae bacterium]|nr:acyl carrier protein [Chlorobiaceae bacterium]